MIDYGTSSGGSLEVNVNVRSYCFGAVWKQYVQEVQGIMPIYHVCHMTLV